MRKRKREGPSPETSKRDVARCTAHSGRGSICPCILNHHGIAAGKAPDKSQKPSRMTTNRAETTNPIVTVATDAQEVVNAYDT